MGIAVGERIGGEPGLDVTVALELDDQGSPGLDIVEQAAGVLAQFLADQIGVGADDDEIETRQIAVAQFVVPQVVEHQVEMAEGFDQVLLGAFDIGVGEIGEQLGIDDVDRHVRLRNHHFLADAV